MTLGRPDANQLIVAAREPQLLTVVLSGDEVIRFLEAVPGLRNRVALTTAYGAGLRVGEVASLETSAIDSSRMLIRVVEGKGGKDRYVVLSPHRRRQTAFERSVQLAEPGDTWSRTYLLLCCGRGYVAPPGKGPISSACAVT